MPKKDTAAAAVVYAAHAAANAARAAAAAADVVYVSDAASDAAAAAAEDAIFAAVYAANAAANAARAAAAWSAIEADCRLLERGEPVDTFELLHLWPDAPDWWSDSWDHARQWLSGSGAGFEIWREWYHGRIEGLPHAFADFDDAADEAFYHWIVEQDNDWWKREPAIVNADITKFVEELRKPKQEEPKTEKFDYFISYAKGDEAFLGEVTRVLDNLDKTYAVPTRDGANETAPKVMEIAERMIALYSQGYVRSEQCQAELVQTYYHDLDTVEQRMMALRFDRADMKGLMESISIHDLSRLPPDRRRPAIAKWIEWTPRALTRENVDLTLETVLDPSVVRTEDAKLDAPPDPALNTPELPAQLIEAMDALRMMLDLARQNERNLSSMMQSTLKLYDDHFTERGRDSSWRGLDRYMSVISEGAADLSAATMREEKAALEQLAASHRNCMDALSSADEQMRELANIPIVKGDPAAIDNLIDKLKQVQEQAHDQDASTDQYDAEARNLVGQGRDFALQSGALDADKKPDTARKRFLRYVGGFGIKTLSVLGSLASIRQTPEFKKLLQAAEDLVEEFYRMIGL